MDLTTEMQDRIKQMFADFEMLGLTPEQSLIVANYRLLFHQLLNIADRLFYNADAFRRECRNLSYQNSPVSFAQLIPLSSQILEALKRTGNTVGAIENLLPLIDDVNRQIQEQQRRNEHLN